MLSILKFLGMQTQGASHQVGIKYILSTVGEKLYFIWGFFLLFGMEAGEPTQPYQYLASLL